MRGRVRYLSDRTALRAGAPPGSGDLAQLMPGEATHSSEPTISSGCALTESVQASVVGVRNPSLVAHHRFIGVGMPLIGFRG